MSNEIKYQNDKTGADERVRGSDNRQNVSARSDDRAYYNSRDKGQCYSIPFDFQDASAGEFGLYVKNITTNKEHFVVAGIGVNTVEAAKIKLHFVSGVAAGGNEITPTNLNGASSNAAEAIGREGGTEAAGISGLTSESLIDFLYIPANGHEEFRLLDRLRLGQNDAIAVEYDEGTTGDFSGVIFGYFE